MSEYVRPPSARVACACFPARRRQRLVTESAHLPKLPISLLASCPQESSFRQFCALPENKKMVEKTQQAEIRKVHKTREQLQAIRFREVVLSSTPEAQRAVAPFLQVPVLRRIVQTIANDPAGEFSKWATNPMILEHLSVAKKAMEDGLITEQEAEHLVLAQIKDPERNPQAAAAFEAVTKPKARLETAQLVGALNEQLQERNAGNMCYKAKRWDEAMSACLVVALHVTGRSELTWPQTVLCAPTLRRPL